MRVEENNLSVPPAVLIGTPGRLADHVRRNNIDLSEVHTLVLDEFDKSLQMGFESDMTATIHFADGEEVVCRKKATGKCYYNFVYPADLAMQGTRAKVVGENYKALTPDLIKGLPLSQPQPSPVARVPK